jgi:hypothetical protein
MPGLGGCIPHWLGLSSRSTARFTLVARGMTCVGNAERDRQVMDLRRSSMIVPQKSTQPIATSHRLVAAGFHNLSEKQHVVLTLVIAQYDSAPNSRSSPAAGVVR